MNKVMEEEFNIFSIKDLENFSGIKAHTIRIWEKRYKILVPVRTDSNIRTYNESELKKILNVAYLNRNGFKISKIARFEEDTLSQKVIEVSSRKEEAGADFQPGKILMSAIRFNNESFKESLFPLIRKSGLEKAYLQYIFPLLEKSRILWQTGSLSRSQEQFIRNSIKQIIIVEDNDLQSQPKIPMITVAMINTSGNLSDNNFLFYRYALRKRGFNVIFTGGILPASEVFEIFKIRPFDYLIVNSNTLSFERNKIGYFNDLISSLNISKIIFTDFTNEAEGKLPDKIIITKDPAAFIRCIDAIN